MLLRPVKLRERNAQQKQTKQTKRYVSNGGFALKKVLLQLHTTIIDDLLILLHYFNDMEFY